VNDIFILKFIIIIFHYRQACVFRTAGATRCPDKREIWHGAAARTLSRAKCYVYRGRNVGIQPQSCQNFEF